MKNSILKKSALLLLAMVWFTGKAQTDPCATNLRDAAVKSEQGWYDEAISLIKQTLENCDLTKNDKIQANKLLIVNYLAIDKIEEAEAAAAAIMKIDPNYEADKMRDPAEVVEMFQKYKPAIVLQGIVYGGANFSQVMASNTYSIVNDNNSPGLDNYKSLTGFQLGLGVEFRLFKGFWGQSVLQYRNSGYSIQIPNVQGHTVNYQEALNFIDIPLSAKYYFLEGKIQPFVQAGVNFSFLNSALGELSGEDNNDIVDRKMQRNTFYIGYFGGAGVAYNQKAFSLQASFNYILSPQNVNKEGTRYDNLDMVFKYYYLDNDFSMNNLVFNIGLTYALGYKNVLTPDKK